jgi:hypothetical protein
MTKIITRLMLATFVALVFSGCFHTVRDTPSGKETSTMGLFFGSTVYESKKEFQNCLTRMTTGSTVEGRTPMTQAEAELFCKNWSEGIPDQDPTLICGQNTACPTGVPDGTPKMKLISWQQPYGISPSRMRHLQAQQRRSGHPYHMSTPTQSPYGTVYAPLWHRGASVGVYTGESGWGDGSAKKEPTPEKPPVATDAPTNEEFKNVLEEVDRQAGEIHRLKKSQPTEQEEGK